MTVETAIKNVETASADKKDEAYAIAEQAITDWFGFAASGLDYYAARAQRDAYDVELFYAYRSN